MNCPRCQHELRRAQYEGVNVDACEQCGGHFVRQSKLKAIRNRNEKDEASLGRESTQHDPFRVESELDCPRCGASMRPKQHLKPVPFQTESCRGCKAVWMDAGELALMQIAFENSYRGRDLARFRERHESMTVEERQQYEKNLSKLKTSIRDGDSFLGHWSAFDWGDLF